MNNSGVRGSGYGGGGASSSSPPSARGTIQGAGRRQRQQHPPPSPFGETSEDARERRALDEFAAALAMIPDEMKPEYVEAAAKTKKKTTKAKKGEATTDKGEEEGTTRTPPSAGGKKDGDEDDDDDDQLQLRLAFLRREGFGNAWGAVLGFVMYWKMRKQAYGPGRYFRSMNLNFASGGSVFYGGGESEEPGGTDLLSWAKTAYVAPLPADAGGSPVIFFDSNRYESSSSSPSSPLSPGAIVRHLFYVVNQVVLPSSSSLSSKSAREAHQAQKSGIVFVYVINDRLVRDLDGMCRRPLDVIKKALPVKVKKIYFVPGIVTNPSSAATAGAAAGGGCRGAALNSHEARLLPALKRASFKSDETITLVGENLDRIVAKLQSCGLRPEALPPSVGGTYNYDDRFRDWLVRNGYPEENMARRLPSSAQLACPSSSVVATAAATTATATTDLTHGSPVIEAAAPAAKVVAPLAPKKPRHRLLPEEALELIPSCDSVDYMEAKKRVPILVEHESPFSRFLACEENSCNDDNNNDATMAAARRLVAYWKKRKEVFGERALLPMNMSSQGALTGEDLSMLLSGHIVLLPDDRVGRPVVCVDMTLRGDISSQQQHLVSSALRVWFYCLHVASEHKKAQSDGLVCLYIISKAPEGSSDALGGDGFTTALPVRIGTVHLLLLEQQASGWTSSLEPHHNIIPSNLPLIGDVEKSRVSVHSVSAGHNILGRLYAYGLEGIGLPKKIGGKWGNDTDLKAWIRKRGDAEGVELRNLLTNHSENVYGVEEPETSEETTEDSEEEDIDEGVNSGAKYFACINNGLDAFTETSDIMAKGLSELEDAISLLPFDKKAALLEAREQIPELAEKEAPPIRFLRFENYNTWAAAGRLAAYWRKRKELFGSRAFLPMNLSGEGALTRDDVIIFSSGYMAVLPYDKLGRTVVCYDQQRMTDKSTETRLRLAFYMFNLMGENPVSQKEGAKILIILRTTKSDKAAQTVSNMVFNSVPVRYESCHITNCPSDSETGTYIDSLVPIMLRIIGFLKKKTNVHVASTQEELVEKLAAHDFLPEGLPECLGGTWKYDNFPHWLELRTRYEWDLPPVGGKDPLVPHVPEYSVKPRSQLTDAEKVERKRRLNVLNSRRKRDRVRVEVKVFNEQVTQLRQQNRELQIEKERLEEFLAAAKAEVAKVEEKPAPVVGNFHPAQASLPYPNQMLSQNKRVVPPQQFPDIRSQLQQQILDEMLRKEARNTFLREQVLAGTCGAPEFPHHQRLDQLPLPLQQVLGTATVATPPSQQVYQQAVSPAVGAHATFPHHQGATIGKINFPIQANTQQQYQQLQQGAFLPSHGLGGSLASSAAANPLSRSKRGRASNSTAPPDLY